MTSAFDTLSAAQHMQDAGMDRKHAEAIAIAIRSGQGELATRDDLDTRINVLRADLDTRINVLRADLDTRISALKTDLDAAVSRLDTRINALQWIIGIHFAISLATLAAVLATAFKA